MSEEITKKFTHHRITDFHINNGLSFVINKEIHNWKLYTIARVILYLLKIEPHNAKLKSNLAILVKAYKRLQPDTRVQAQE